MNNTILKNANALLSYQKTVQQRQKPTTDWNYTYNWEPPNIMPIWEQASNWVTKPITKKMSQSTRKNSSTSTRTQIYKIRKEPITPFRRAAIPQVYVPSSTKVGVSTMIPRFSRDTMLPIQSTRKSTSMIVHHASTPLKTQVFSKKKNLKNRIKKGFINAFKKIKNIIRKDNRKIKEKSKKKILNVKKVNNRKKVNNINKVNNGKTNNKVNNVKIVNEVNNVKKVNFVKEVNIIKKQDNLELLNKILKCLEENYTNEFSFVSVTSGQNIKYTFKIKDINMGFEITYTTFREFIDKIIYTFGNYLSYCSFPFTKCPNEIKTEIESFIKYYKRKENKDDDKYLNKFKNIINAILHQQRKEGIINELPSNLIKLLKTQTNGGRKRRPKKLTIRK